MVCGTPNRPCKRHLRLFWIIHRSSKRLFFPFADSQLIIGPALYPTLNHLHICIWKVHQVLDRDLLSIFP